MHKDTASTIEFAYDTDWFLPVSLSLVSRYFMVILLPFIAFAVIN